MSHLNHASRSKRRTNDSDDDSSSALLLKDKNVVLVTYQSLSSVGSARRFVKSQLWYRAIFDYDQRRNMTTSDMDETEFSILVNVRYFVSLEQRNERGKETYSYV